MSGTGFPSNLERSGVSRPPSLYSQHRLEQRRTRGPCLMPTPLSLLPRMTRLLVLQPQPHQAWCRAAPGELGMGILHSSDLRYRRQLGSSHEALA